MEFLQIEFWQKLLNDAVNWVIHSLPELVLTFVICLILLILIKGTVKKLTSFIIARTAALPNTSDSERKAFEKRISTLIGIIHSGIRFAVLTIAMMIVLRTVGVDIAPLIAGAGVLGLAVGFGAQELVKDFISGFFIILENQIRIGDVASVNGNSGVVEAIGLRTVSIRDAKGALHIIRNGQISIITNMTRNWSAALITVEVDYYENLNKVIELIKQTADAMRKEEEFEKRIINDLEVFGLDSFDNRIMKITVRIKTLPAEQWGVGAELRQRIKAAFDAAGVQPAVQHQKIRIKSEE